MSSKFNPVLPPGIRLLVGLGNPGARFRNTYHNAGVLAVNYLAESAHARFTAIASRKFSYVKAGPFLLVKSSTFMNQSGEAVANALAYFEAEPRELLILQDDSDLPLGTMKLSFGRGAAGHHGVESVIAHLHTNRFFRLRIGTRRRSFRVESETGRGGREKAGEFALRPIAPADLRTLYSVLEGLKENVIENASP